VKFFKTNQVAPKWISKRFIDLSDESITLTDKEDRLGLNNIIFNNQHADEVLRTTISPVFNNGKLEFPTTTSVSFFDLVRCGILSVDAYVGKARLLLPEPRELITRF